MATFLPDKLNMTEYKPSMVGIPTQSVARLYDRLDKQAYAADAQSSKMKIALASQIAVSPPGDQAYLQNMYNSMDGLIDTAKEEKNLPGYANQIRNMVSDMASDQTFAAIQSNGKKLDAYNKNRTQMEMNYGAENIIDSGDNPNNFSTINAETGEMQQFMGSVTKRPDYTAAMMKLFKTNTDVLENEGTLEEFVHGGGEEGMKAFRAYRDTPEGRIHMNDLANEMFDTPFIRLPQENQIAVIESINERLQNAGLLEMNSGQGGANPVFSDKGMFKKEYDKAIISSGIAGTSLTEGTSAEDQTIQIFDDQVDKSEWDNRLKLLFQNDREHISLDVGDGFNSDVQGGAVVDPSNILAVHMTSALSPSGRPIAQVTLAKEGKRVSSETGMLGGEKELDPTESRVAYIEMPMEDTAFLQDSAIGFMHQVGKNTRGATKQAALPLVANVYAPELGQFIMNNELNEISLNHLRRGGLKITREDGYYRAYNEDGSPLTDKDSNPYRFATPAEVRAYVGRTVLKSQGYN